MYFDSSVHISKILLSLLVRSLSQSRAPSPYDRSSVSLWWGKSPHSEASKEVSTSLAQPPCFCFSDHKSRCSPTSNPLMLRPDCTLPLHKLLPISALALSTAGVWGVVGVDWSASAPLLLSKSYCTSYRTPTVALRLLHSKSLSNPYNYVQKSKNY